jgi:hypothetical protein
MPKIDKFGSEMSAKAFNLSELKIRQKAKRDESLTDVRFKFSLAVLVRS